MPTRLRRMRPRGTFTVPTPTRSWVVRVARPHRLLLPYLAQPPQHWRGERAGHQQRPSPGFGRIFLRSAALQAAGGGVALGLGGCGWDARGPCGWRRPQGSGTPLSAAAFVQGLQAPRRRMAHAKTSPWHGDVFVPPRQEGCSRCPRGPRSLQVPWNALSFPSQLISDESSFRGVSKAPQ